MNAIMITRGKGIEIEHDSHFIATHHQDKLCEIINDFLKENENINI